MAAVLTQLHRKALEVAVVLTNNPEAEGIQIAKQASIPCEIIDPGNYTDREAFDAAVVACLGRYRPNLTVLAGFMRILTPVFTEQIRAINLHPSLLPRHKGLRAIEKSYEDGYDEGGVTIHWVSAELDGGETILQKHISKKGLSFAQYEEKVKRAEKEALVEAIRKVLTSCENGRVITFIQSS